jgi:beta-glucanase (GH16 family)
MKLLLLFVVIVILVRQSKSEWVLKWNDEFDDEVIDTNKWEIENESGQCHGMNRIFFT